MANYKKFKNRFVTTIPFEKEYYDKMNQLLPRGVAISDEINKFIQERVGDLEREKNREASILVENSPIKIRYGSSNNISETLDKYISFPEDKGKRVKELWDKDSIYLYDLSQTLDTIQEEISTVRWKRYKQNIPKKNVNLKLIPFIEQSVYSKET